MKNKGAKYSCKTANKKLAFCRNLPLEILKYYVNLWADIRQKMTDTTGQKSFQITKKWSERNDWYTGCTRLGENNVNPKVMQYVMGHSDAQITMNIYNHIAEMSHVENEMSKMNLPETVPAVV